MKNWGQELKENISKLFTEENFIPVNEPSEEPVHLLMIGHLSVLRC